MKPYRFIGNASWHAAVYVEEFRLSFLVIVCQLVECACLTMSISVKLCYQEEMK